LMVLLLVNALVRRIWPGAGLCRRELMVLYGMLATGSSLVGHDTMQMLVPSISHVPYFASPSNHYNELIAPNLPSWLTISAPRETITSFEQGHSTLYQWQHIKPWLLPIGAWSVFLLSTVACMLSINILLHKHWDEHERLAYPIVRIPLLMTEGGGQNELFRNKLFWIGFGIAASIDLWQGFVQFFPSLPALPNLKQTSLAPMFTQPPWNVLSGTNISFYPFAIGLSYFMPTNMAFSSWFFFLFRKAEQVVVASLGYQSTDAWFPYLREQSYGALLVLFVGALWLSRGYLKEIFRAALNGRESAEDGGISYRWTLATLVVGLLVMIKFLAMAGMSWWVAAIYVVLYMAFCGALTRLRAELGPPAHEFGYVGTSNIMILGLGTALLGPQNLTVFSLLHFQNRMHRGILMPQQAESLKAANESGLKLRTMVFALALAAVVGVISAFWAMLHLSFGRTQVASVHPGAPGSSFSREAFDILSSWLANPVHSNTAAIAGVGIGAVIALVLTRFNVLIYGFPFHPAGFALGMSFGLDYIWCPIFISWLVKVLVLRYAGLKGYRATIPFFVGLVLGEFAVGGMWSFVRGIMGVQTYTFFY
ncbi:hypothetical protein LLG39_08795, partial [bacterium]|nr:hypothetical protein [bacterium]